MKSRRLLTAMTGPPHTSWLWALCLLLLGGASTAGGERHERYERSEPYMGTEFHIVCYAGDAELARLAMADAFRRIGELDSRLSDYQSASELSQLSLSAPHEEWRDVSRDLWSLLVESQRVSRLSGGAFDVTLGPLTRLWRRARRRHEVPPQDLLQEARSRVGYQYIVLRDAHDLEGGLQVKLQRPDMRLDLGGIAKGYAAEEALRVLARWGIERALVDAGGDLAVGAPPPAEVGWRIGIAPLDAGAPPSQFLRLAHRSVATSGDFWQAIELDGQRYSHILDPRTGWGVTRRSTVSVIARRGSLADALASAVSVLGPEEGGQLVRHWEGVELLVLVSDAGGDDSEASETHIAREATEPGDLHCRRIGEHVIEWRTPGWDRYLEGAR
jgi:FAD:protein FMN transferase